jgi:hypothetical protein
MVLMLTALHVLVGSDAKRGDLVSSLETPGQTLGLLRNWGTVKGSAAIDAALVWVDPARVSAEIAGLGAPSPTINPAPQVGDELSLCPWTTGGAVRTSQVQQVGQPRQFPLAAPGWNLEVNFDSLIICSPMFSCPGDSGAAVLDAQKRVVGIVVGSLSETTFEGQPCSQTWIAPIQAILEYPAFAGKLQVLNAIPPEAMAPPGLAAVPGAIVAAAPPAPQQAAPAVVAARPVPPPATPGGDATRMPAIVASASNAGQLQYAQHLAAERLLTFDGETYPADGCAITLSVLLQQGGIDVPSVFRAIDLGDQLRDTRRWTRVEVGNQAAGDVGSTCGPTADHGADHIYLVLKVLNQDEMVVADNQEPASHFRFASGQGKTPTTFFLRPPA